MKSSHRSLFKFLKLLSSSLANLAVLILLAGCSSEPTVVSNSSGRISVTHSGPAEVSQCTNVRTFTSSVTITGKAVYQHREIIAPEPDGSNGGLGDASSDVPIRFAEIRVTNKNGEEVQCGETDNNGDFSIALPQGSANYKIAVLARANTDRVKVSILDRPERNNVYSISTTVNASSSSSAGTLRATVDGAILGAPFFMFDLILKTNEFLLAELGSCSSSVDQCSDFTVAPKSVIYWEAGFNPNSYFGSSSGISFYLPGYSRMFILGGVNGNTNRADTDHFDPSIVIHEYGHFLEDAFSDTDSPGGAHYGDRQIDPRLAWSEAWGNFIQAAVLDDPYYIDTIGHIDNCDISNINPCTDFNFYIPIEDVDSYCDDYSSGCDEPEFADEGNFREFAITRFLWDLIDADSDPNDSDNDTVSGGFPELWAAMTSPDVGLKKSTYRFRDIGLLTLIQNTLLTLNAGSSPITEWSAARAISSIRADRKDYAQYAEFDNSCSTMNFVMTPHDDDFDTHESKNVSTYDTANWLRNNDFHHIYHAGGNLTLTLNYQSVLTGTSSPSTTCNDDLDLYLYDQDARFGNSTDIVAKSITTPTATPGDPQVVTVTKTNLAVGHYLINVMVYLTDAQCTPHRVSLGDVKYEILNGSGIRLCP